MKTKILAIVSLFILSGCFSNAKTINGDGNIIENNVTVLSFYDIEIGISGRTTVNFRQADNYSLTIITDQNIMPQLIVKNNGSKLNISSTRNTNLRPTQLTIIISSPNIEQFEVNGSTTLTFETPLNMRKLNLEVNGASKVTFAQQVNITDLDIEINGAGTTLINDLNVRDLDLEINGAGYTSIEKGIIENLDIEISGSGKVKSNCEADVVSADIAGSGSINVIANRILTYDIAGSGTINYRGNAQIKGNIDGSGRIQKM